MAAISNSSMTIGASSCASSCRGRARSPAASPSSGLIEQPAQNRRVHDNRFSQFGNKGRIALRLDLREGKLGMELAASVLMHAVDQKPLAVFIAFDQV